MIQAALGRLLDGDDLTRAVGHEREQDKRIVAELPDRVRRGVARHRDDLDAALHESVVALGQLGQPRRRR